MKKNQRSEVKCLLEPKKKANSVHFQKWNMLYQCINLNQQPPKNENKKHGRWMQIAFIWLIWNLVVKTATTPELNSCNCVKKVKMVRYLHCCKSAVIKELKNLPDMVEAQCKVTLWESFSLSNLICPLLVFFTFLPSDSLRLYVLSFLYFFVLLLSSLLTSSQPQCVIITSSTALMAQ